MEWGILRGRAIWIFSEPNFDVDRIVGVAHMTTTRVEELVRVCMRDFDATFPDHVQPNDLLIGGDNFGYGHPHYQAMIAMRAMGIVGVVAESFAPDFLRGEAAAGFPLVMCAGILQGVTRFDVLEVDWRSALVRNVTRNTELRGTPLPAHLADMIAAGGLLPHLQRRRSTRRWAPGPR